MSTRLSDYDYQLPEHLIAMYPPEQRGASRLLVIDRARGTFEDMMFSDITRFLTTGDVLVANQTKVIPARLQGQRTSGGHVEIFLHQRLPGADERWNVLAGPARKARVGEQIVFAGLTCTVEEELEAGERVVIFDRAGTEFLQAISRIGQVPLPPYIRREAEATDTTRYQTVFASVPGAVAAPTAGLHFTDELLGTISGNGVVLAKVTLHTGLGTFRSVTSDDITQHEMHEEYYDVAPQDAGRINDAHTAGKRVFAVGTTTVRALETLGGSDRVLRAGAGMSRIFIYPPYEFKIPDAIITNFHQPRSTLIMMISAFAGREFILEAYAHAIRNEYRFFSYGDAMLIL